AHGGCPHASIELAAIPEMSREEGDVGRPRARERCRPGSPIDCRPIDDLVRAQLRKTEWNTGAREKDLAHLGGLDGRTAARSVEEGAPVGASIFSVNVNVPWNPPFRRATSTVTGPTFSSRMSRIGSPGPTCCFITRA